MEPVWQPLFIVVLQLDHPVCGVGVIALEADNNFLGVPNPLGSKLFVTCMTCVIGRDFWLRNDSSTVLEHASTGVEA